MKNHDTDFKAALAVLEASPVEISVQANEQGHLFKGLHAADIAKRFEELSIPIIANEIILLHPIKSIGDHTVSLRTQGHEGSCVVRVVSL